jgi:hypothetical protein
MNTVKYWPFDVFPAGKRTQAQEAEVKFMEEAFREGYKPYNFEGSNYGASAPNNRAAEIIHRGISRYWELFLSLSGETVARVYVDGLEVAGQCVLQWLGGADPSAIISRHKNHIVSRPGDHGWM